MPVPLPSAAELRLTRPDAAEVELLTRAVITASSPAGGPTPLQRTLVTALATAMTGHPGDVDGPPVSARAFAEAMGGRNEAFRHRMVHFMLLAELVLVPLSPAVEARVEHYAAELSVSDDMFIETRHLAKGSLGLAALDFQRNGYVSGWGPDRAAALHTSSALDDAWGLSVHDQDLAARWTGLGELVPGTLGRRVHDFYCARGFVFPGMPGSGPPLLAQHDWVHVLAGYGTSVESELEVFGFIARASDDPRAFSLLATVVSLFETGQVMSGMGLFQYDRGHLSQEGMAVRLADAMRRGAICTNPEADDDDIDMLRVDWFALADQPLEAVRGRFGLEPKSPAALEAGSVTPWERGGISRFQEAAGRRLAEARGQPYCGFGAALA